MPGNYRGWRKSGKSFANSKFQWPKKQIDNNNGRIINQFKPIIINC